MKTSGRAIRILYWIGTVQVAFVSASGGAFDAIQAPGALEVLHHLGYPDYFASIIGVAKVLGAVALLAPVPRLLREWAYAGLTFDVLGAIVSILAVGDPLWHIAIPLYFLTMLQLSRYAWYRQRESAIVPSGILPSPNAA